MDGAVVTQQISDALMAALTPVALLRGRGTVGEAVADLDIATYLGHLLHGEVLPAFPEYDDDDGQGDDGAQPAHETLLELADAATDELATTQAGQPLVPDAAAGLANWRERLLPVAVAAWERGDNAPGAIFALAAAAAQADPVDWRAGIEATNADAGKFAARVQDEATAIGEIIAEDGVKAALKVVFGA